MDNKAANIVQNVGAIAETVSVFYNSIAKQVPKDVALVLTQHFMDLTINRTPANVAVLRGNAAAAIAAVQEQQRRAAEQKKRQQEQEQLQQEQQQPQQEKEPSPPDDSPATEEP